MNWYPENPYYLILLLLLPILGVMIINYIKWKKNKQNLFAEARFQEDLFEKRNWFTRMFPFLYFLAFAFLIFAIVDIMKGSEEVETKQKMNNVIFLLDVSNSMNVEDVEPSRLTEAKNIVLNALQKFKNDRVGIVVFAGEAASIMPLTTDYTAVDTYLNGIESNIIQVQGTDFLKGMQVAASKFKNISKGSRKIILISDGEDNEGNENAAIREANNQGMSVISVGVGTEEGAPIPSYLFGQLMGYKTDVTGETVISKRQTDALKKIASSTDGIFVDGNNIQDAVNQIINELNSTSATSSTIVKSKVGIHYYQYFLGVSLFLFLLIYLLNPKRDFNI